MVGTPTFSVDFRFYILRITTFNFQNWFLIGCFSAWPPFNRVNRQLMLTTCRYSCLRSLLKTSVDKIESPLTNLTFTIGKIECRFLLLLKKTLWHIPRSKCVEINFYRNRISFFKLCRICLALTLFICSDKNGPRCASWLFCSAFHVLASPISNFTRARITFSLVSCDSECENCNSNMPHTSSTLSEPLPRQHRGLWLAVTRAACIIFKSSLSSIRNCMYTKLDR